MGHTEYTREYRKRHPEKVEANRARARERVRYMYAKESWVLVEGTPNIIGRKTRDCFIPVYKVRSRAIAGELLKRLQFQKSKLNEKLFNELVEQGIEIVKLSD